MAVIRVGQRWRTRGGQVVFITADRGEDAPNGWRWACSNSQIVNDSDGRVSWEAGRQADGDLVELVAESQITDEQVKAMDSTWGSLGL